MATSPSTKPYLALSAVGDDDDDHQSIPYKDGVDGVATQSFDLQKVQSHNESLQKERSFRFKFLASTFLLIALAFGGREYYTRFNQEDESIAGSSMGGSTLNGVRGSSNDVVSSGDGQMDDAILPYQSSLGASPEQANDLDGSGEDGSLGGEAMVDGNPDDEVKNGEAEGGVNSDEDNEISEDVSEGKDEAEDREDERFSTPSESSDEDIADEIEQEDATPPESLDEDIADDIANNQEDGSIASESLDEDIADEIEQEDATSSESLDEDIADDIANNEEGDSTASVSSDEDIADDIEEEDATPSESLDEDIADEVEQEGATPSESLDEALADGIVNNEEGGSTASVSSDEDITDEIEQEDATSSESLDEDIADNITKNQEEGFIASVSSDEDIADEIEQEDAIPSESLDEDIADDITNDQEGGFIASVSSDEDIADEIEQEDATPYESLDEDIADDVASESLDEGIAEETNQEDATPSESLDEDIANDIANNEEGGSTLSVSSDEVITGDGSNDSQEEESLEDELVSEVKVLQTELVDFFVPLTTAEREEMKETLRSTLRMTRTALAVSDLNSTNDHKNEGLAIMSQRTLVLRPDQPKQFMHMHHMKTGGTSMDGIISCALRRQKVLNDGTSINYARLSECGSRVKTCMDTLAKHLNASVTDNVFYGNDPNGEPQVDAKFSFDPADDHIAPIANDLNICKTSEANLMSYCASLHAVRTFGWKAVDKITVIRNPVDRAWSMYRFTLNRCYRCQELKDVLRKVENGTFTSRGGDSDSQTFAYSPNDSCAVQMLGHQATNLLSSVDLYNVANDVRFPREKEIVEEAVSNLRNEFTWIGITDRIEESVDGIRTVFPFLAENLNEAAGSLQKVLGDSGEQVDNGRFSLPDGYNDSKGCPFEHKNAGMNPTCGTKELDEETIALIKKLNNRDVAVYKAAVERFELQMEVLSEYKAGTL